MRSLQDLTLTGGDFRLVQQVMCTPGVCVRLTVAQCDMLMVSDVAEALSTHMGGEESDSSQADSASSSGRGRTLRLLRLLGCKGLDGSEVEWEAVRQGASGIDVVCIPPGAG
jgi:hypothetical protein